MSAIGMTFAACLAAPPRSCAEDDECRLDGALGTCQPDGFCAYEAAECPSGIRYGPFAADRAERCTSDCAEVSPDLPCAEDPACPDSCAPGDPTLVATWSPPTGAVRPHDVAVGPDGAIAAVGALDDGPLLLVWEALGAVRIEGPPAGVPMGAVGRGVDIGDDGTVWVASDTRASDGAAMSRVSVVRVSPAGERVGGVDFATLGEQEVYALEVDATGAATVAGRLDGRPWLERRAADDRLVWSEAWDLADDSLDPVDMAGSAGGRVAIVGVREQADVGLRLLDPTGAASLDAALVLGSSRRADTVDLSAAGLAIGGRADAGAWVAALDDAGAVRWLEEYDSSRSVHGVVVDARGWVTLIGVVIQAGESRPWIEQRNAGGKLRWTRRLPVSEGAPVAAALDPMQRPVVLGVVPGDAAIWVRRFEP